MRQDIGYTLVSLTLSSVSILSFHPSQSWDNHQACANLYTTFSVLLEWHGPIRHIALAI